MLQEIITYIIVASALVMGIWKILNKLRRNKRKKKSKFTNEQFTVQHNCSNCPAECVLRDASEQMVKNNPGQCQEYIRN